MTSDESKTGQTQDAPPNARGASSHGNVDQGSDDPNEAEYPPTREVLPVMLAIFLTAFLAALDRSIIATAIPQITNTFDSLSDVGWYGSAFLLTTACFQCLWGRVYTFHTPKYVFLTAIAVFEVGSAVCGAAPSSTAFIVGRALAGMGTAGMQNGAILMMIQVVPLAKRPTYQGAFGAVFGISSVAGPLLGGAFTTKVSWRWCFYINLPIGGLVVFLIFFLLKPAKPTQGGLTIRQQLQKLDLLGEMFLIPSVICLLLALQWGGSKFEWSNGRIIALLVIFGVLLLAFVAVQVLMQETATISTALVRQRSIVAAIWFVFCSAASMMIMIYYIAIWFQVFQGVNAVQSGIHMLPLIISMVVGAIFAGKAVSVVGYYTPFMIASPVFMAIGAGLISTFNIHTSEAEWICYQVLFGFGLGLGQQQASVVAQTVLSGEDIPMGVSVTLFFMTMGGAIFISVAQNLFSQELIKGLASHVPGLNPAEVLDAGATDLRELVPADQLAEVLVAYNGALRQVFYMATSMTALAILGALAVEWRSVKDKKTTQAEEEVKSQPEKESGGNA